MLNIYFFPNIKFIMHLENKYYESSNNEKNYVNLQKRQTPIKFVTRNL